MRKKYQRGQTLIEALLALSVIVIVITAISILIITSLYNAQYVKDQNLANKYAQQGMEFIRGYQSNNIAEFATLNGAGYCIDSLGENILPSTDPACNPTSTNAGSAHRSIEFIQDDPKCPPSGATNIRLTRVIVKASWSSSKCTSASNFCHSTVVESCIPYSTGIEP